MNAANGYGALLLTAGFWRDYAAFVLVSLAVLAAVAPGYMFGVDRYFEGVRRSLPLDGQTRLSHVLAAGYDVEPRARLVGYGVAGVALLMAAFCLIPGISPGVPVALGVFAIAAGTSAACVAMSAGGAVRVANLVRRNVPAPFVAAATLAIVATLGFAANASLRLGSILVALALACLLVLTFRIAEAPARLRGQDPTLESAVANLVWRNQVWTVAGLLINLATLNAVLSMGFQLVASHASPDASLFDTLVVVGACVAISVASLLFTRSARTFRDPAALLSVLTASPA